MLGRHLRRRAIALVVGLGMMTGLTGCSSTPPPASDFSAAVPTTAGMGEPPAGPAVVEMPHLALRLDGIDVADEVGGYQAQLVGLANEDVAAADGYELVVATVKAYAGSYGEGEPMATVEAGGEQHDITALAQESIGKPGSVVAMLLHVPVGEPITLSIADEGRTVSLDLRTGELAEEAETAAVMGLYQRTPAPLSDELESEAVVGPIDQTLAAIMGTSDIWISAKGSDAPVRWFAWLGGDPGWAPDGEGFVGISELTVFSYLTATPCGVSWSPADSFTLTPEGGEPLAPIGTDLDEMIEIEGQLVFQVPTEVTDATLTLDPHTSVSDDCETIEPFEAVSVPVDLG